MLSTSVTGVIVVAVRELFVAGRWTPSASGETFTATSPATGEEIAHGRRRETAATRSRAIAAARGGGGRLGTAHRVRAGREDARRRGRHRVAPRQLATTLTLDQGKPLHAEAYDEVDELVEYWRMAAEDAKRLGGELPNSFSPGKRVMLVRRPRGVVGGDQPVELALHDAGRADRAGARPPATRSSGRRRPRRRSAPVALARAIVDADLPPGVFNLVTGPGPVVGDEIARNPGLAGIAFIGSTATGALVASAAAGKATLLEMGGNGPLVVMDDANVAAAVEATLAACFLCAGQSCTAGERILVHEAVRDEYVELLARAVAQRIVLGDPFAESTTMGPLNNEPVAAKMDEHVADALEGGATLLAGGARASGFPTDLYWQPTVLDGVRADARVAVEETFGPVAPVVAIDSLEQAIELTNASPYGLLAAIWTADLARGLRFADAVRTGWVNVNESTNYWEAHLPFGGRAGTGSGIGRVGGAHVMHAFTELQTVVVAESP